MRVNQSVFVEYQNIMQPGQIKRIRDGEAKIRFHACCGDWKEEWFRYNQIFVRANTIAEKYVPILERE